MLNRARIKGLHILFFMVKRSLVLIFMLVTLGAALQSVAATLTYSIHGMPEDIEKNVMAQLETDLKQHAPLSNEGVQKAYERAPSIIQKGIEPFGYFEAKVTPGRLRVKDTATASWRASFDVKLGHVLKITQLTVQIHGTGATEKKFKQVLTELPIAKGQTFNMKTYDNTKDKLTDLAAEEGYLDAKLTKHQVIIDKINNTCKINIQLDTGSQYYFGKVIFKGSTYSDKLLQRYVNFKPGERYTSKTLLELQNDLNHSVYFSYVSVHPKELQAKDYQIPIIVELKPRKAKHYSVGIGYGTDTGVRGTAGFDWYHITNSGHYFKSFVQLSEVQSTLQSRYVIPGKHPATDQYFVAAGIDQQDIHRNQGDTEKVSIGRVDKFYEWQRTISLAYQFDNYSINSSPYQHTHLLLPSLNLQRSHVDNVVFPRKGYSMRFNLLGSAEALASSNNILQSTFDTQWVFSPFEKSRLLLRGNLGVTWTDSLIKVPLSLQFFAGGAESIRGYDYQELGPGRYLIIGSVEYQHQVKGNWWGTAFVDTGNAVNSLHDPKGSFLGTREPTSISLGQLLKTGVGVGIVYVSPVGPIKVTVAKPINDTNKEVKVQLVMGANL